MKAEDKILRAKTQMYSRSPFFSYILLHMKFDRMDKKTKDIAKRMMAVPTMGVDPNGNCYWNEDFVNSLSQEELTAVIAHEVLHIALLHCERIGNRDPLIANYAQDLVVNSILMAQMNEYSSALYTLPKDGVIPDRYDSWEFTSNGKTNKITNISQKNWEEIYEEMIQNIPKMKQMAQYCIGGSESGDGQGLSNEEKNEAKNKLQKIDAHIFGDKDLNEKNGGSGGSRNKAIVDRQQKWKGIVAEAASLAKKQGKLPAGMSRLIDELLDSKINWKQVVYRFVVAQLPFDYHWCLEKNTLINSKGGDKLIKDIRVGDIINGEKNGVVVDSKVLKTIKSPVKEKFVVYTKRGNRVVCSGNHKILTPKGYVKAKDLRIGDIIKTI